MYKKTKKLLLICLVCLFSTLYLCYAVYSSEKKLHKSVYEIEYEITRIVKSNQILDVVSQRKLKEMIDRILVVRVSPKDPLLEKIAFTLLQKVNQDKLHLDNIYDELIKINKNDYAKDISKVDKFKLKELKVKLDLLTENISQHEYLDIKIDSISKKKRILAISNLLIEGGDVFSVVDMWNLYKEHLKLPYDQWNQEVIKLQISQKEQKSESQLNKVKFTRQQKKFIQEFVLMQNILRRLAAKQSTYF